MEVKALKTLKISINSLKNLADKSSEKLQL
jgi:hypothetical protein